MAAQLAASQEGLSSVRKYVRKSNIFSHMSIMQTEGSLPDHKSPLLDPILSQ
jgi:hypothetical protein